MFGHNGQKMAHSDGLDESLQQVHQTASPTVPKHPKNYFWCTSIRSVETRKLLNSSWK